MTWQEALQELRRIYPTLPPAKQLVANYIFDNYGQIPFLTVTDLAVRIGVSDTTIINLCTDLGFKGYAAFKRLLRDFIQAQGTMVNYFTKTTMSDAQQQDPEDIFLSTQLENIHKTLTDPVNRQSLAQTVELINAAPRVCIIGFRASGNMAQIMAFQFRQLSIPTEVITPGLGDYLDRAFVLPQGTVVIAFSFARYTESMLKCVELLKSRGYTVIGITDMGNSPLRKLADLCFYCRTKAVSYKGSYTGCLALIELISAQCALQRQERTLSHLRQLEDSFDSFHTFYAPDSG